MNSVYLFFQLVYDDIETKNTDYLLRYSNDSTQINDTFIVDITSHGKLTHYQIIDYSYKLSQQITNDYQKAI